MQEYWSGLSCPLPGHIPNPGIEPASLTFPALAGVFFTISATWEALLPFIFIFSSVGLYYCVWFEVRDPILFCSYGSWFARQMAHFSSCWSAVLLLLYMKFPYNHEPAADLTTLL